MSGGRERLNAFLANGTRFPVGACLVLVQMMSRMKDRSIARKLLSDPEAFQRAKAVCSGSELRVWRRGSGRRAQTVQRQGPDPGTPMLGPAERAAILPPGHLLMGFVSTKASDMLVTLNSF